VCPENNGTINTRVDTPVMKLAGHEQPVGSCWEPRDNAWLGRQGVKQELGSRAE
jgi:hypothetical protein